MPRFFWSTVESQIGTIYVASTVKGICKIAIPGETKKDFMTWLERHADKGPIVEDQQKHRKFADELNRYFGRKLVKFHVRLDLLGTPFQRRVWKELRKVRYGTTISYRELSRRVGMPRAYQTVGRANGANPLPIVIPCHRIIGSDDKLVGYAAGIKTKEFLLRLEGALLV
ncbi:MAG: hypothetical protein A2X67_15280 [Ignavibacteria bacterium GWA2_55_11]|nr:MAG: hypothetical protein A2X67_15280 [Ignavibacteria bacterium GWA2_55_11]OGU44458.1 MAG: hypothetical protein A2X68_05085 [Ignavibacteria bacterium GWC2_56_12]OGU68282.1 MAG: hypothetical protein A3C56_10530 [Ignavibacteria bacterium RIFCSPHIGHO2_02_FULL_56_12]OGU72229.1 MAG: hypothetical protein A3H45_05120 [Ignavibacteria bacterium RIFCSPLOWO2_02_FULL_55_14]OGU72255.1 MAG: hypothetical protein A3G43_09590 [Ignavibacteria bacterium RIFCSPLOWO2_12_FULL_56_21]